MTTDDQNELFDVVDETDTVIGQATRGEIHSRGWRHRSVHILLFNLDGELFLQKRAATKDKFPGCWDSSASGHLDAGETYDHAAARELEEELGLGVNVAQKLTALGKLTACLETGWEHVTFYVCQTEAVPQPNPREIETGRFMRLAEVMAMVQANPEQFAPGFIKVLTKFCEAAGAA